MPFFIYRQLKSKSFELLGQTRYIEDAQAILQNWHSGYITANGEIIETKNFNLEGI